MRLEENKKIKSTIPKELQNSNEEKKINLQRSTKSIELNTDKLIKKTTNLMRPTRGSLATDLFIDEIQDFNRTFGTKKCQQHMYRYISSLWKKNVT
jgi:hypothetical protein